MYEDDVRQPQRTLSLCEKILAKDELDKEILNYVRKAIETLGDIGITLPGEGDGIEEITMYGGHSISISYSYLSYGEWENDTVTLPIELLENPTKEAALAFKKKIEDKRKAEIEQQKKVEAKRVEEVEKIQLMRLLKKYGSELEIEKIAGPRKVVDQGFDVDWSKMSPEREHG